MTLQEYNRKRDFRETPEPTGAEPEGTPGQGLRFVIQKHDATRLHYDLRLEVDGVLKSWAVPKGPSMNPEDKRLAVQTEDHPLDYLDFEDVIPKGEYGGGPMMVWDWGTYTVPGARDAVAAEEEMRRGLAKGHVTFTLDGEKARGTFHLVHMSGKGKDQWLLFHKDDELASDVGLPGDDLSVKTGRTMDEIMRQDGGHPGGQDGGQDGGDGAADGPFETGGRRQRARTFDIDLDTLDLEGAEEGPMPTSVEPMLASVTDDRFDREGWLFEIKWDGFRAIAEIDPDGAATGAHVRLYSRTQGNYENEFALIVRELDRLEFRAVLDGEIVVVDDEGKSEFRYLQHYRRTGEGTLVYYVFDLLYLEGYDLLYLPLARRKALLAQVLPDLPHVKYSQHVEEEGVAFFRVAAERGLEGVIAKDGQSGYQAGVRSAQWLKFKARQTLEALIGGFTEPRGGRKKIGALILGLYDDDGAEKQTLTYIGHTGTGLTVEDLHQVRARLEPLRRKTPPFATRPPTNAPPTWVEPEVVCRVAFASWTE
ncbi:MAG TPA: non-homologous end-joining DNA ligase, partial [Anaerolineae bacterium]|nr:non-homologous end-joining DNA ligase [Anaerolineae bacterium]